MKKLKFTALCIIQTLCLLGFSYNALAEASKKIVKWTDDKGVTHYGDMLPSQDAGRGNAVLNKEGVTIRKNASYSASTDINKETEAASAEQIRKDSALLASYSSVEEIDLAMARHLQTEENALKNMQQRLLDARATLKNKQALQDGMIKNKKNPPNYLVEEINALQQKITKTEPEMISSANNIALTQTRFANYKTRYAELRPRNNTLATINVDKKNLAELELWKKDANQKLSYYLSETVKYKRAGTPTPKDVSVGIELANQEIARADQEIAAIRANIKDSQQTFSSR